MTTEELRAAFGRPRPAWLSPGVLAAYLKTRNDAEWLESRVLNMVGFLYWTGHPYTPEVLYEIDRSQQRVAELRYAAEYLYFYGGSDAAV